MRIFLTLRPKSWHCARIDSCNRGAAEGTSLPWGDTVSLGTQPLNLPSSSVFFTKGQEEFWVCPAQDTRSKKTGRPRLEELQNFSQALSFGLSIQNVHFPEDCLSHKIKKIKYSQLIWCYFQKFSGLNLISLPFLKKVGTCLHGVTCQ